MYPGIHVYNLIDRSVPPSAYIMLLIIIIVFIAGLVRLTDVREDIDTEIITLYKIWTGLIKVNRTRLQRPVLSRANEQYNILPRERYCFAANVCDYRDTMI